MVMQCDAGVVSVYGAVCGKVSEDVQYAVRCSVLYAGVYTAVYPLQYGQTELVRMNLGL